MQLAAEAGAQAPRAASLRVLITNITLATRTGTETYVRDLALALLKRGHTPLVYTTDPGEVAHELRAAGAPVVADLALLAIAPDVIHGHHRLETYTALLRFPDAPAIFVCHDRLAWHDAPPRSPRLLQYVAVDDNCRDRLLYEHGISPSQIRVIPNSVDLERFPSRAGPPERLRRALVFGNDARANGALHVLREGCRRAGLTLDVVGAGVGNSCAQPERTLREYDVVFAKARCALEALAVGTAVVLWNEDWLGPLVRTDNLERLRRLNLGRRALTQPLNVDAVLAELNAYDPQDAAETTRRVRGAAGLETMVDNLSNLYREVMAAARTAAFDPRAEMTAAADYLRELAPIARRHATPDPWAERETPREERDRLRRQVASLQAQLTALRDSRTMRLRKRLLRIPLLPRLVRRLVPGIVRAGRAEA